MPAAPAPPRWRTVVGVLSVTETISWGALYYAFGVLVPPMQAELGWSQGLLGGAFSLALFVAALASVPVGRVLARRGPRALMTAGSGLGAAALLLWSWVAHPLALFLVCALLGLAMAAVLYEAAFSAVVGYLGSGRRTDSALLVLTVVAGFASTIFVPLTQALVDAHGWRAALRWLALLVALGTVPLHAWALRGVGGRAQPEAPERAQDGPLVANARERRALYGTASAFALAVLAATATSVYLVSILLEQGFDAGFAARAVALLGVGQCIGRVGFTFLRPRMRLALWSLALFAPPVAALAGLASAPSSALVLACVLAFAVTSGGQTLGRAAWAMELFPLARFARVNGVLALWSLVGRAGAPLLAGALHDVTGSHGPALLALAGACALGGVAAWWAARD